MTAPTTDRELLEMAAKAAGYEYAKHGGYIVVDGIPGNWNPLTDDGDALRLAVQLGLSVEIHRDMTQPLPWLRVADRDGNWTYCGPQDYHGDELAQTRRAIVRAAAKIGKAMP